MTVFKSTLKPIISAVPTNIITGFLGVGKTTFILNLLKNKPADENWAVLVNEFGEMGIDGSLLNASNAHNPSIFIREVPGGCMCCAAGLPMQIALNQLLQKAKPDRLLIEPTGLGHPEEVLQVLCAAQYQPVLHIQHTITLVDARNLNNTQYTTHGTFNQQIAVADKIIGSKADLYTKQHHQLLQSYITNHKKSDTPIAFTEHGKIDIAFLKGTSEKANKLKAHINTRNKLTHAHKNVVDSSNTIEQQDPPIPACGYIKTSNKAEGYSSIGWRFSPEKIFNRDALIPWFRTLKVERAKALFITHDGVFGYNMTKDSLTEIELDDCFESRIEIITNNTNILDETGLFSAIQA